MSKRVIACMLCLIVIIIALTGFLISLVIVDEHRAENVVLLTKTELDRLHSEMATTMYRPMDNVIVLDELNFTHGVATGELFIPGGRQTYNIVVFEGRSYIELHP
jgi:hypothetical protein